MNTADLYDLVWSDDSVASYVMLVGPSEILRYVKPDRVERCYILHTALYGKKKKKKNDSPLVSGSRGHWFCVILRHGFPAEIFDTHGDAVSCNSDVNKFINVYGSNNVNGNLLNNRFCGFYCLVYAYLRSRNMSPRSVIKVLARCEDIRLLCFSLYGGK